MKKIYIAGPFRSDTPWGVACNVHRAESVALEVAHMGGCPVCPHAMFRNFDKQLTDEFWLAATLELLKMCDVILMLRDWEESEGANTEYVYARNNGIRVFDYCNTNDMQMLWGFCK